MLVYVITNILRTATTIFAKSDYNEVRQWCFRAVVTLRLIVFCLVHGTHACELPCGLSV